MILLKTATPSHACPLIAETEESSGNGLVIHIIRTVYPTFQSEVNESPKSVHTVWFISQIWLLKSRCSSCLDWPSLVSVQVQRRSTVPCTERQLAIADFVRLLLQYCKLYVKFHNPLYSLSLPFHDRLVQGYNDFANSITIIKLPSKAYYQYDGKSPVRYSTNRSWLVLS